MHPYINTFNISIDSAGPKFYSNIKYRIMRNRASLNMYFSFWSLRSCTKFHGATPLVLLLHTYTVTV